MIDVVDEVLVEDFSYDTLSVDDLKRILESSTKPDTLEDV